MLQNGEWLARLQIPDADKRVREALPRQHELAVGADGGRIDPDRVFERSLFCAASHVRQIRATRSRPKVNANLVSGMNATEMTLSVCAFKTHNFFAFFHSQIMADPSMAPLMTSLPSELKATSDNESVWPRKTASELPVAASHTRTVWSFEPVTTSALSPLNRAA